MQLRFISWRPTALCLSVSVLALTGCPGGGGETETDGSGTVDVTMTGNTTPMTMGTTGPDGTTNESMTSPTNPTDGMTTTPDPTDGGGGDGQFCQEQCAQDSDCTIGGMDMGYKCVDARCQMDVAGCTSDQQCTAQYSGWSFVPCAAQADCDLTMQICVDLGGGMGGCATPPSDFFMCETAMLVEVEVATIDGMTATVCGAEGWVCQDSVCTNPCEADAECANLAGHPTCNTGSGVCECSSDADCAGSGIDGYAVCINGKCGCGADSDCVGANSDTCYDGSCGCSAVEVCTGPNSFGGTTKVCEGA